MLPTNVRILPLADAQDPILLICGDRSASDPKQTFTVGAMYVSISR